MLVHRRVTPSIKFAGAHLYTWVEIGTVRGKCFAQEHNTMFPARVQTLTTRSGVEGTNHEATAPPSLQVCRPQIQDSLFHQANNDNLNQGIKSVTTIKQFLQSDVLSGVFRVEKIRLVSVSFSQEQQQKIPFYTAIS